MLLLLPTRSRGQAESFVLQRFSVEIEPVDVVDKSAKDGNFEGRYIGG